MTPKMVANFRRSLSFPNHPNLQAKPKKTLHVRSTSLPCRSHPLLSQLKDQITDLKSWAAPSISSSNPGTHPNRSSSSWLCDGLNRLRTLHDSLDDLLHLPQTRETLSAAHFDLIQKLLQDFLCFVDVYGIFQNLILSLKEEHCAAQVALRRKDDSRIESYVKNLKKLAKEMDSLVSAVQSAVGKHPAAGAAVGSAVHRPAHDNDLNGDGNEQLDEVMKDVVEVTFLVSKALFCGLSVSLRLGNYKPAVNYWRGLSLTKKLAKQLEEPMIREFKDIGLENLRGLRKKGVEEMKMLWKSMHDLEECIVEIEEGAERTFRSLINTRVSLLNVLTQYKN